MLARCVRVYGGNWTFGKRLRHNSRKLWSLSQSFLGSISVWTEKQFENDIVDEEHFIHFHNKNAVIKFIPRSVNVA